MQRGVRTAFPFQSVHPLELFFWITLGVAGGYALGSLGFPGFLRRRNKSIESRVAELADAKEYAEALIEKAPDGILVVRDDMQIVQVNEAYCRMAGRSREELVGKHPPYPGWAPEEREMLTERGRRAFRGDVEPFETTYVKKNGERFPSLFNPGVIRTKDGTRYVFATVKDITQQKKYEEKLRESEAKFRRIAEISTDTIYQLDVNGTVVSCSPGVERVLGYKLEEFVGTEFRSYFLPEDLPAAEDAFLRSVQGEEIRNVELRILNKNGKPVHIEVNATPIWENDSVVGSHGVARDITERKVAENALRESEAWLRTTMESLPIDLFALDESGRYVMQNSRCRERWGDVRGKRQEDVADDPETLAAWQSNSRRAFAGEVIEGEASYKIGGKERSFYNVISPVYDEGRVRSVLVVNVDITDRKRAEAALQRSEERLRTIISAAPNVAIEGYDIDGRVLFWNRTAEDIFGWTSKEAVGKTLDRLILDDDSHRVFLETLREVDRSGEPSGPAEWTFAGRDGQKGTLYSTVFAIPLEKDKKEFVCMDVDITDRKRAEAALRESEKKYRLLFEHSGVAVTLWDEKGELLMVNQNGARYLGATPEELVGKSHYDLFAQEEADRYSERLKDIIRSGVGAQFEDEVTIGMGKRWFRSNLEPIEDAEGRFFGVQIVSQDVTKLVQAERSLRDRDARLRLMVGQVPAVLWTTDRDLRFTSSTGAGLGSLDLAPGEVVGLSLFEYFGTDDPEFLPIAMHRRSLEGQPTTFETTWDGRVWETHVEPLRSETGEIIGCLAIGLDVTERKRAHEELRESREQLRALAVKLHAVREEESAVIAREVHDELGQALTGLKMDLHWVERRLAGCGDPEDQAKLEEKISTMKKEIDATVQAVREISTRLRPRVLDDLGLVGAIEWQASDFQRRTGIPCVVNQYGLEEKALGLDSERSTAAFRILQEILTNVRRHAEARQVWIDLRSEDDVFVLEVRDDGKGIPADAKKRLEGLGIVGMRERALVFGGQVSIKSTLGKGTCVTVSIPLLARS